MASYDVASTIHHALADGHVLRYTIRSSIGIGTIRFTGNDNNISSFKPQFVFTPDSVTQQGSVDVTYTVDDCLGNDLIELEDQYDSDGAFVYDRQNCLNVTVGPGGYGSPRHKMPFYSRNTCLKYVEGHLER